MAHSERIKLALCAHCFLDSWEAFLQRCSYRKDQYFILERRTYLITKLFFLQSLTLCKPPFQFRRILILFRNFQQSLKEPLELIPALFNEARKLVTTSISGTLLPHILGSDPIQILISLMIRHPFRHAEHRIHHRPPVVCGSIQL